MSRQPKRIYEFGPFRLDPTERLLLLEGEPMHLPPKAFDILLALVENGGRIVEKQYLLDRVWPDTFVEEGNLKVAVFTLRKTLEAGGGKYIETVPRRGYRFTAEVKQSSDESDYARPGAQPGAAKIKLIAILPLRLLVAEDSDNYLGLGMADALITRLSNLKQVVIRPTSAVLKYADVPQDPVAAGRELKVEAALEGSIQKVGRRIRVTVQLVSVEDGAPLWADQFDEEFTDIFAVEDSISEQVARAMTDRLTGHEKRRLTKHYTENTEAYHLYVKGRYYWTKRTLAGTKKGIDYFQKAIDIDPTYSLALSGLADCYAQLGWLRNIPPVEAFPKAKAAAKKAIEIDDELAEAHTSMAWIRMLYDRDWEGSENDFKRALDLNPNYAIARLWHTVHLIATARFDEASAEIERALNIDPLSPIVNTIVGWPFYFTRRYGEAIAQYKKALETEPDYFPAHLLLGYAYAQKGEMLSALESFQKAMLVEQTALTLTGIGHAHARAGLKDRAMEVLAEIDELSKSRYVSPYDVAQIYVSLGENDRAFEWLERACDDRSSWLIFLGVEPGFDPVRADPRLKGILRRIGLAADGRG
jgi:DNA-binding winged helix-turn-helix (wHTH) protein/tetratricopeptide (TPR) repeat protein